MSEQRKFLGKKRKKIFVIEKTFSQRTPKNLSIEKINLSPVDNIFTSEEIPTIKSSKINLNLSEKNEIINSKIQKHSLINISNLVYDFLKTAVHTTGNEVTTHIKNIIQSKNNNQPNQKNIQRRVYDAINVMCAVGLIKKNKQEIQYINYKNKENNSINLNNVINLNEEKEEEKTDEIEEKIRAKTNELDEKRKILTKNYLTIKFYEKYHRLNEIDQKRKYDNKLLFPFDLIRYDNSSPIKMTSTEDSSRYVLLSNSEFVHFTPYDIIKKLISYDILVKINENMNNISDNKTNRKKSTNENSLIEEVNYNINNESLFNLEKGEKGKNKHRHSHKKNKIFSDKSHISYNIPKDSSYRKYNEEKDDDLILEYLRNIKSFMDEIISNSIQKQEEKNLENEDMDKIQEDPENIFEKENINFFSGNKVRKNSNFSNWSNIYDENDNKKNNEDLISEIEIFMQNFK
jgi:hypothetical protein